MEKLEMLKCIINYYTDRNNVRFTTITGVKLRLSTCGHIP